ncbi:cellulose binding domain-containing protein [Streptomyces curacoi]|uniref:cellulose binding domain-containing protein n=1 Tax=Streptomyces curacoi TaxID=146536 RepID=UPI000B00824E|nr:cellulose binding domain-containing protein [Streptomyces curacoi]
MRHPPRSVLLAVTGAVALVAAVTVPVVTAQGATPACTVEYSVTSPWDGGKWSQSGTTVTAADENWNGALGTGGSVSAGFIASLSGGNAAQAAFRLNGTTCNVAAEPTPTDPPGPGDGTVPALRASGNKLVDADGTTRRLLGVNRSGGEFACVQGNGIWDGPVDDASVEAIADWNVNTVRIPLNEECRLGLPHIKPEYAGAHYIGAVLLGGLAYSNDLSQGLTYRPTDPAGNLAAAWHVYNFNACANESCWNSSLAPVAAQVPLVAGEIGENTCAHSFVDRVMKWFEDRDLSYLGWTWNTCNCSSGPALISSYDGTPTAYGIGLRDHLRALDG